MWMYTSLRCSLKLSLHCHYYDSDRRFRTSSDDSGDDVVIIDEDLEEKMSYLRTMFPGKSDNDMQQALLNVNGDVERAIDVLISAGNMIYYLISLSGMIFPLKLYCSSRA